MRCDGKSAKTPIGIILEKFKWDSIEYRPRHILELSERTFDEMQLKSAKKPIGIVID